MARWRRHVRLGLGAFAVVFAVALWFIVGARRTPGTVPVVERLDPKAISEIRGGDVLQHKGVTRDIRVEFGSQVAYDDGRIKFTTFKAFVDDRGGRSFVISGQDAWVGTELSSYDLRGQVTLTTSDGLTATTSHATFTEADGLVMGEGPVQFQRERVTGTGVGFTYDRSLDRLWLLDQAVVQVAPSADSGGLRVRSGAAGYSRAERYLRFERGMRMEREHQTIEADHSTVFLRRDRDEPESVELRGGASIGGAGGHGSLQAMRARDINLRYGEDGRTLQWAQLVGDSAITLAGSDGTATQQLQGDWLDVTLAPDGAVTRLVGRDRVRATLLQSVERPARAIEAPSLAASGEAGKGLTTMTFDGGVEFREDGPIRGGPPRVAQARSLTAAMSTDGNVDRADFSGGFRFTEGPLSAASAEARYAVSGGELTLRSPNAGPPPHVADERVVIDAAAIDVTLAPRAMTAKGKVSAQFLPGRRSGGRGMTLLSDREAVIVNAETFVFDEASGAGSYSGKAVVWQQSSGTSIRGEEITLNEKTGTLKASGGVVTTLPIEDASSTDGRKAGSVARADEFRFDDASRLATLLKSAQLDGAQGNLHAARIELLLAPTGNALERLDAQDAVKIIVDSREATGQRLSYHPADQRYVLTGSPVRLVEGCQESTGRTLTFFRSSDRIQVDGNEEIRVQTKGGKCPDAASLRR
ncbi:MAG: hypothetical protein ACT4QD_11660 [Acidobacteriota bacterium]